jgi:hypothetical protein
VTSGLAAVLALVIPGDVAWLSFIAWPPAAYMSRDPFSAGFSGAFLQVGSVHTVHAIATTRSRPLIASPSHDRPSRPRHGTCPARGLLPPPRLRPRPERRPWVAALPMTLRSVTFSMSARRRRPRGPRAASASVDGGPSGEQPRRPCRPPTHDRRIDLVVLTHPRPTTAGLHVLDRFHVGGVDHPLRQRDHLRRLARLLA